MAKYLLDVRNKLPKSHEKSQNHNFMVTFPYEKTDIRRVSSFYHSKALQSIPISSKSAIFVALYAVRIIQASKT